MIAIDEIKALLKSSYPEKLWKHTESAMKDARGLAAAHSVDIGKAELAALLHDYGKNCKDLLAAAEKIGITPNAIEAEQPLLLHGTVGASMVEDDFGVDDKEVLSAIRKHTFGALDMSPLDKIIYVSDMVEAERDYREREGLRSLAMKDLDEGFCACLAHKLQCVLQKKRKLHPNTAEVWNRCLTSIMTPKSY